MSQGLVTKPRNETFNAKIKALKERGCNMIGNEIYFDDDPPLCFKYAIEVVNINPDPKFQQVYPQKGGGFSLTGLGLKIISKAMNVRSLPGQIVSQTDKSTIYRARAYIRGLDGQPVTSEKDYEFSFPVQEDQFLNTYTEKARKYQVQGFPQAEIPPAFKVALKENRIPQWIKEQTRVEMIQTRKTAHTKAQTGAQLRCIRDLGPIQSTYTADQLKMPFLIVKLVQHLDPNNAVDRQFALDQSRVPMAVYSENQATPSLQQASIDAQAPVLQLPEPDEALEIETSMEPLETTEVELPIDENQGGQFESALMDYDAIETPEQIAVIQDLINVKGWNGNLNKTLKQFTDGERRKFFEMLVGLPKPDQTTLPWS